MTIDPVEPPASVFYLYCEHKDGEFHGVCLAGSRPREYDYADFAMCPTLQSAGDIIRYPYGTLEGFWILLLSLAGQ